MPRFKQAATGNSGTTRFCLGSLGGQSSKRGPGRSTRRRRAEPDMQYCGPRIAAARLCPVCPLPHNENLDCARSTHATSDIRRGWCLMAMLMPRRSSGRRGNAGATVWRTEAAVPLIQSRRAHSLRSPALRDRDPLSVALRSTAEKAWGAASSASGSRDANDLRAGTTRAARGRQPRAVPPRTVGPGRQGGAVGRVASKQPGFRYGSTRATPIRATRWRGTRRLPRPRTTRRAGAGAR